MLCKQYMEQDTVNSHIQEIGDCCSPSVYLTVIDKTSNFVRCHLYLGDVNISTPLLQTSATLKQVTIGYIMIL
ncbi:hypothetical protein AM593_06682, partial [Mytilus galloprovincialis]